MDDHVSSHEPDNWQGWLADFPQDDDEYGGFAHMSDYNIARRSDSSFALRGDNRSGSYNPIAVFQQVSTKVPPSFDGTQSWFAYEQAIEEWLDVTELDEKKVGPALRSRLTNRAAIYKQFLDRERLKKSDGVQYFKNTLRPYFIKGAESIFLWRFLKFFQQKRHGSDFLGWITNFQLSVKRLKESWGDLYRPVTDTGHPTVQQILREQPVTAGAAPSADGFEEPLDDEEEEGERAGGVSSETVVPLPAGRTATGASAAVAAATQLLQELSDRQA